MEIQDYLKILKARWIIIAVTVVVAILGALGASLLTTPLYESSARMFVSTSGGATVSETYQGNLTSQQLVASYSELATSDALAARVLNVLPLGGMSAAQLASKVKASSTPDTVLFNLTVTDPSSERARDIANAMATELTEQVRELETPANGGDPAAGVKTFQQAEASSTPVSPKTKRNLALGAAVGLLLGIALAVLRDRLDNTIKGRREIEAISGKALVGTIPFDKERKAHPAVDFQDLTQSASAEAFRELRTNLQFLEVDHPPRVIVVTSAIPSEGKTTTAVNLAVALAEAGHHVALVEGDLRRPRVSKYMGLIGSVGMSTVLAGQATVEEVLQPTKYEGLQAMASGPIPPNPSELLGSEASRALLVELRSRFDYVIVDGAPLLPVTDSAVLTTHADGALLVTRYGHTKSNELARAIGNLETIGARVLGVVLALTPSKKGDMYSYSYNYTADTNLPGQVVPPVPAPAPQGPVEPSGPVAAPTPPQAASTSTESAQSAPSAPTDTARTAVSAAPYGRARRPEVHTDPPRNGTDNPRFRK
ncbi:polysaccharide biosynthesis tyrosine autokinase [Rhodococcus fascians]|uniref:polysaccharide biosynthesis tyrosine autokinase n=1 Tax=Rhodococcoides fascians TaxID=1828 RepID=UPI00195AB410|nr:polysaccharide biosynthesis tyrosine autokinase [Rhodococcus fascians]MBM7241668.1 polysaccharide biosynthesis tyrosine autokinase [Rhodococcus fascians]MBY3808372.1 polysaccharide biosynthesis tyrosine autokinase [Rhodococcus fascians]MBY3839816.1 polysaccharide biosynthesis tyrosine autokinase [Rhodococcus fascians]MBY3846679.1 polysaccharide biosynthesis tyrosine autokinase [Rhodococcus fascians]MBY3848983.1 polysaccharide biosynthesis tyrosine autokinase [Rhodococcus fascians]